MSRSFPQHSSIFFNIVARAILALGMLTVITLDARSQSTSVTDGATPLALQPGAPNGAYALSGFDNINLFNGHLKFRLPIAAIAGRGEAASALMIPIERKWRVLDTHLPQPDGSVNHVYMPVASFWKTLPVLYNPGGVEGRHAGYDVTVCPDNTAVFTQSLTRLTFTTPDGTEDELRDTLTNGRPNSNASCNYLTPVSRGTVFVTADGSAATFVSDSTIYDQVIAPAGDSRGPLNKLGRFIESHEAATGFESQVLADFTGWWEKPVSEKPQPDLPNGTKVTNLEFSSVTYLILHQNFNVVSITKYEKQKPRKQP